MLAHELFKPLVSTAQFMSNRISRTSHHSQVVSAGAIGFPFHLASPESPVRWRRAHTSVKPEADQIRHFFPPSPSPFETWAAAAAADSVEATPTASDHRGLRRSRSICPSSTFIIKCSRSVKSCEDDAHTDWLRSVKCEMGPLIYLTISDGHFSLSMWPRRMRSTVAACCLLALASQILHNIQKAVHYVTVYTEQQRADCARPVVSCRSREILFICDQNRLLVSK